MKEIWYTFKFPIKLFIQRIQLFKKFSLPELKKNGAPLRLFIKRWIQVVIIQNPKDSNLSIETEEPIYKVWKERKSEQEKVSTYFESKFL